MFYDESHLDGLKKVYVSHIIAVKNFKLILLEVLEHDSNPSAEVTILMDRARKGSIDVGV